MKTLRQRLRRLVRRMLGLPQRRRLLPKPSHATAIPIGDSGWLIPTIDPETGARGWRAEPRDAVEESRALGYGGA